MIWLQVDPLCTPLHLTNVDDTLNAEYGLLTVVNI
jgi:hypothetical protein